MKVTLGPGKIQMPEVGGEKRKFDIQILTVLPRIHDARRLFAVRALRRCYQAPCLGRRGKFHTATTVGVCRAASALSPGLVTGSRAGAPMAPEPDRPPAAAPERRNRSPPEAARSPDADPSPPSTRVVAERFKSGICLEKNHLSTVSIYHRYQREPLSGSRITGDLAPRR
jgi:hypothetical protein